MAIVMANIRWPGILRTSLRRGQPQRERSAASSVSSGFTLIEVLVVLALLGLMVGVAVLASRPDPEARLKRDVERLQLLFGLAAEEAQLRARALAWQGNGSGYAFLQNSRDGWTVLRGDDEFRARNWEAGPVRLVLTPPAESPPARLAQSGVQAHAWIEFARDGVQRPFVLHLELAGSETAAGGWNLRGDGQGRYAIDARP